MYVPLLGLSAVYCIDFLYDKPTCVPTCIRLLHLDPFKKIKNSILFAGLKTIGKKSQIKRNTFVQSVSAVLTIWSI